MTAVPFAAMLAPGEAPSKKERHLRYVANPGIRNYEENGGAGVVIHNMDDGCKFVKRIPIWDVPAGQKPENVKGIAAGAKTGRIYVTTRNHMVALDAIRGQKIWDKTYEGGCDRMAISPNGCLPRWTTRLWRRAVLIIQFPSSRNSVRGFST